jgi:hypothetical protein
VAGSEGSVWRQTYVKNKWMATLALALAVYPAANIAVIEGGVILKR